MNIVVLTPVRLLGDGLSLCICKHLDTATVDVVGNHLALRSILADADIQVVLVDVTQGVDLIDVSAIAIQWPDAPLVAIGITEVLQEVVKCGRAGFAGYISREASIEALCQTLQDVVEGKLACPPEIAGGMLRALFHDSDHSEKSVAEPTLTRREREVLEHSGHGLTNKEIAKELCLSVATVKHHVHHVLEKLSVSRRAEAMRRVQEEPWLASVTARR